LGGTDQTAELWEVRTGKQLFTLKGHSGPILAVAVSPDDRWLATAGNDQSVMLWDAVAGEQRFTLAGHNGPIRVLAFSRDGRRLVTGSADQSAKVWDVDSRACALTLRGHSDCVIGAAFSPDGKRIGTASDDGTAKVWDSANGRRLFTLVGHHGGGVSCVRFSPDGQRILTSGGDQTVKVWESRLGTNLLTLQGHSAEVYRASFSPDGRRIVSGSSDRTAKVWDATTGKELLTLKGHTDAVGPVAFSPDGRRIATGSMDQTAKVWQAATPEEVALWHKQEREASERLAALTREQAKATDRERADRAQDPGAIRQWLVLTGIKLTDQSGVMALNQEQVADEAHLHPLTGESIRFRNSALAWRAVYPGDYLLDFDAIDRVNAKRYLAYALCYIRSETNQTGLSLKVGSDDLCKIDLNGREIYRCEKVRTYVADQDEVPGLELKAGLNVLVYKAVVSLAEARQWRASMRFTDAWGQPLKSIRVTLTPASDQDPGAISRWLVLAPIGFAGTNGATALEQQQLRGEAQLRPRAGEQTHVGGCELVWREFHRDDYGLDFIELSRVTNNTNTDYSVAYAVSYLESDTNQTGLSMKIGSDDQSKVYLNGQEIYRYEEPRSFFPDRDTANDIALRAGLNVLVFKVVNERVDWRGSIRFTDAAGQPVKGIRATLQPPPVR
jgi:hypothetical protein